MLKDSGTDIEIGAEPAGWSRTGYAKQTLLMTGGGVSHGEGRETYVQCLDPCEYTGGSSVL